MKNKQKFFFVLLFSIIMWFMQIQEIYAAAPNRPSAFKQPTESAAYEKGATLEVRWGSSLDVDTPSAQLKYTLRFYNGSTWTTLTTTTGSVYTYTHQLPMIETTNAKYEVVANDGTSSSTAQTVTFSIVEGVQRTKIYTCDDLQNMSTEGHYELANDIDCSESFSWGRGVGFKPIGSNFLPFRGSLDGAGHVIKSLTIKRTSDSYVGLFGYTEGARIKNVGLRNAQISGRNYVGGLVGYAQVSSEIELSYVTGSVKGTTEVGGLVGRLVTGSRISNAYSTASVTGTNYVGGLVGYNGIDSLIEYTYATGSVTGESDVGGIVGSNLGAVQNSNYDKTTTGQSDTGKGNPLSTSMMKTVTIYSVWDRTNIWIINAPNTDGYPKLRNNIEEILIDTEPPVGILTASHTEWTNTDVVITAVGNDAESGLDRIKLPSGAYALLGGTNATTYTVSTNGTYIFEFEDMEGNVSTKSIVISNIDKTPPTGTLTQSIDDRAVGQVVITATGSDSGSGMYRIKRPDGNYTYGSDIDSYVGEDGTYQFVFEDNAGNTTTKAIAVEIDKTPPADATFSVTPTTPTNGSVFVSINYPEDATTKQYKIGSDETWRAYTSTLILISNDTVYARSFDASGNGSTETSYVVSNIDKISPIAPTFSATPTTPTNGNVNVTISYSGDSTVKEYRINGGSWLNYTSAVSMTDNGSVEARGRDAVGNYSLISNLIVSNIDKTAPASATFLATPVTPTNGNVTVTINYPGDAVTKQYKLGSGGTWTTYTTAVSVTANNTIYARSYDAAGNVSAESSYVISNIDKTAPTTPTFSATPTAPTNGNVSVTISYSGDSIVKEFSLNGGAWTTYTAPIILVSNGTVEARGQDNAGNVSVIGSIYVTNIDKLRPGKATFSATPTAPTNGNVTVTISYPGDATTKQYKLGSGGTWTTYTSAISVTDNNTIYARSYDAAGNVSDESNYVVSNIDKTVPTTPTFSAIPLTTTNGNVTVTIGYSADSTTKEYRIDGGAWTAYTAAVTLTANGKVEARGANSAGSYSSIGSIDITYIDKTPPASATFSATPTAPTNGNVSVTIAFPGDAVTKQYKVGSGGTWTAYTSVVSIAANNTIYARSYDAVGNLSVESNYVISNIDKTAPTTPTLSATPTTPTNGNVSVTITYSGDSAVKEYRINGGTWTAYSTPISMTTNGKVEARGKDSAGNYSTIGSIDITNIDKTPPASATFLATPTMPTNGNVSVTIAYPEDATTKQYKLGSGGTWTTYTTAVSVTANNTIYARSYDAAGNVSAETNYVISNIDKTAPTTPILTATPTEKTNEDVSVTITYSADSVVKEYRVNEEAWTEYTTAVSMTENGKVEARGKDNAGNYSAIGFIEIANIDKMPVSKPTVTININPQPTGAWTNQMIDVYITDSGDFDLLNAADKKYQITNSPEFPSVLPNDLSNDRKITLNLIGVNYLHVQYTLEDGTKISSTAGPYLIDTGSVGDFEVKLLDTVGNEVTNWSNKDLKLSISDPSTSSISGIEKQYRIENYHTDWQPYTPGTTIKIEGNNRVFARIISKAGMMGEQKYITAKIDKTAPVLTSLILEKTNENTYNVTAMAKDSLSGIKQLTLNNAMKLESSGSKYISSNLSTKPMSINLSDEAGNTATNITFAAEPTITYEAPYTLQTEIYRNDVKASISGGTTLSYKVGSKLTACTTIPCTITIGTNSTLSAIHTDGIKQTIKTDKITNIDKTALRLYLNGERDIVDHQKIKFNWNYNLSSGVLTCFENGVEKTHNVSGIGVTLSGFNYLYECTLKANYGGENLTSNRVIIYPNPSSAIEGGGTGTPGVIKTEVKTNVYVEESKIGTSYYINTRSNNYKPSTMPLPQNNVTAN